MIEAAILKNTARSTVHPGATTSPDIAASPISQASTNRAPDPVSPAPIVIPPPQGQPQVRLDIVPPIPPPVQPDAGQALGASPPVRSDAGEDHQGSEPRLTEYIPPGT
jgi:hypothetical protein